MVTWLHVYTTPGANACQANAAQKRLKQQNTQSLKSLHLAAVIVNALFIISRFLVFRGSFSYGLVFKYVLSAAVSLGLLYQLESIARSGGDLGQSGVIEYMLDVVYLTFGIQILVALVTDKAWWLYLAV